jgi:hypothetical protein
MHHVVNLKKLGLISEVWYKQRNKKKEEELHNQKNKYQRKMKGKKKAEK